MKKSHVFLVTRNNTNVFIVKNKMGKTEATYHSLLNFPFRNFENGALIIDV